MSIDFKGSHYPKDVILYAMFFYVRYGVSYRTVGTNGVPERIAIYKSGANLTGLQSLNIILKFTGTGRTINIVQSKHLNNIVEQDHRFIKKFTRPMLAFKAFYSAAATLAGIEAAHIIRQGQLGQNGVSPIMQFAALTG